MRHKARLARAGRRSTLALFVGWFVLIVIGGAVLVSLRGGSGRDDEGQAAGSDRSLDEVAGVPLLHGAYRTEGALADGLDVPAGTVLLGDVLPSSRIYVTGNDGLDGWRAYLLVVGDVDDVLADLDGQAGDLDLDPYQGPFSADGCAANTYQPPDGTVTCQRGWRSDDVLLSARLTRGVVPARTYAATDRPVSLLEVSLAHLAGVQPELPGPPQPAQPPASAGSPPSTIRALQTPTTTAPDEPLPSDWPQPPGPGERLGDGIVSPDSGSVLSLRVPDGAHAVVAPWPTGGNAENYEAIMAVTGDGRAVVDDLHGQIVERLSPGDVSQKAETVDGAEVTRIDGAAAGGDSYEVTAVTTGGRTWIVVSTGYD